MANTYNIPWKRLLAEGTAIVLSILLAFSIQAWWDERQDHVEESAILTSLLPELTELEELVSGTNTYVRAIRESAIKLLEAGVGFEGNLNDDEIDVLLKDVTWFVDDVFIDTPVLGSLLASGDLALACIWFRWLLAAR